LANPDLSPLPRSVDVVINYAVLPFNNKDHYNVNAGAAGRLARRYRDCEAFVHGSTGSLYAYQGERPLSEDDPYGLHSSAEPYAASKIAAEFLLKHLCEDYRLPMVMIRIFSFYGPRGGGVTQRLDQVARGEPVARGATIGVLALQGDVAEHVRAIGAAGGRPVPVRRRAELESVEGLIIPGGESTTIWKLLSVFELAGPLRSLIAGGLPVFGSCAGMILLAGRLVDRASDQETLGAIDMTVRRNAFGRQLDSFESDILLRGAGGEAGAGEAGAGGARPFRAVFIRAPWVEAIGPGVEILATEPGTGKIVAVRQGKALATAFHPELTQDNRVHKIFIDMVREG